MNPNDEYMHPVGDDPAWSESYYFNFCDPKSEVGMFARMGFRANEGTVDGLMGIYLGGHRVAFVYAREQLPEPYDTLKAGGMEFERREPFKTWGVRYDGPAQDIADDRILVTRRKERPEGWFKPAQVRMDVTFKALNDPYYTANDGTRGHFEQAGHATGTIQVGDDKWDVDAYGVRDKSWGPRTWAPGNRRPEQATAGQQAEESSEPRPFIIWFSGNIGADMAFGGAVGRRDGEMRGQGWLFRDGENLALNDVVITSEYEPDSILHKSLVLQGVDEEGVSHRFNGGLVTVTPTKIAMPSGATFVNEGLARFEREDGAVGYGIAEYWHTIAKE